MPRPSRPPKPPVLEKALTGIRGLDEVTAGGLPRGRPTLVVGNAGCGKTLLAMQFVVNGVQSGEPGVYVSFEETEEDLSKNFSSLGWDLQQMQADGKLMMDFVKVERSEIEETGAYDLEGLFVRLGYAIDTVKAKRIVLDTIEVLFSGLKNEGILRAEIRRLFHWLKARGVTTVVTGESIAGQMTRHGLEEFVSDCVIFLDHRVTQQVATRRLRVVKYRGSGHGTNEYPYIITPRGIVMMPVTSMELKHSIVSEKVSSGIEELDAMLGGGGFYKSTSILVSGTAGTGKTTVAASFVDGVCSRGEKAIYFSYEESPDQVIRNMNSAGIDLGRWVKRGLLTFHNVRPTYLGLEAHLVSTLNLIHELKPSAVVIDPISNLVVVGDDLQVRLMLTRLVDYLKDVGITALFTSLTSAGSVLEKTEVGATSVMDSWLMLTDVESGGERNRVLYVLKSRGMPHSHQTREFLLTDEGIKLVPVYTGAAGVLTGAARLSQEARERAESAALEQERRRRQLDLENHRRVFEARVAELQGQFDMDRLQMEKALEALEMKQEMLQEDRITMADRRMMDEVGSPTSPKTGKGKR
ncbi:MAG: circadian clock protein KaiC [Candidatus Geothermincolia bacterium]